MHCIKDTSVPKIRIINVNMTLNNIFILFLVILNTAANIIGAQDNSEVDKRLLLDDPQTVTSQMLSLQREIQTLQTKIAEIDVHQSQIQLLNAQIAQLQQENAGLKQQISQVNSTQDFQILTNKIATLDHELPLLKMKVDAVVIKNQKLLQHSGTTFFPIWGRKSCPVINGTELVYTGITAGKSNGNSGSGTNTLCLPHNPDSLPSDFPITTYSGRRGYLYGAEYQFTYKNVAVDDDVPCAICKVKPATTTMMVPAKLSCPKEWTLQYHGYLGTAYVSEQATDFICVDSDPEFFEGLRQINSDGHLIYPVISICGALPCPNYKASQYLSCAVCTL